ncbi:hypothetical protein LTR56_000947 [Elasticomyces elasticus]|nr:hypothetical protein LTR56_000947 [Elasticomyces elasticus]KAK3665521.1 hypothetical protein LTR22_003751 [Elasticomyces elasticus]KAK4929836.1 hypothetical protein LTR49_003463 [Elasticomyces elasticus]KAK5693322.1 hypothetical protein LTR17_025105 [Elasticomyces elasticus]KAK5759463.1 hypothetical protein LTS12_010476 [Elasticomyces elasticus]
MASGFGLTGGPSRCFPFWQEVLACYVVNTNSDDDSGKHKCKPVLEDYYECLHHKKEATKIAALQAAYRRKEAQTPRDQAPSAGEIRSLGLLDRKAEQVDISGGSTLPSFSDNMPKGDSSIAEKVGLK